MARRSERDTGISCTHGGRIHLTDGGIVGIAAAPAADGGVQAITLQVHGRETPEVRADAEVRLDEDELTDWSASSSRTSLRPPDNDR